MVPDFQVQESGLEQVENGVFLDAVLDDRLRLRANFDRQQKFHVLQHDFYFPSVDFELVFADARNHENFSLFFHHGQVYQICRLLRFSTTDFYVETADHVCELFL